MSRIEAEVIEEKPVEKALTAARQSRNVIVSRMPSPDGHAGLKDVCLLGKVEGAPEATWITRTIPVSAIVSGRLTLAGEKEKLIADVEEYHDNYVALQEALKEL